MQREELYQAYVVLTIHIAMQVIDEKEIGKIANQATTDAIRITKERNMTGKELSRILKMPLYFLWYGGVFKIYSDCSIFMLIYKKSYYFRNY